MKNMKSSTKTGNLTEGRNPGTFTVNTSFHFQHQKQATQETAATTVPHVLLIHFSTCCRALYYKITVLTVPRPGRDTERTAGNKRYAFRVLPRQATRPCRMHCPWEHRASRVTPKRRSMQLAHIFCFGVDYSYSRRSFHHCRTNQAVGK